MAPVIVGGAIIGVGLAVAVISWGKAIWQEFLEEVDGSFEAEMRRLLPELYDQDGGP